MFAETKTAFACLNAAFAYSPALIDLVSAVFAATKDAFAYDPAETTAACRKLFAVVILSFRVFAAAEDATTEELVDVSEPLIKLDVNI